MAYYECEKFYLKNFFLQKNKLMAKYFFIFS